MAEGSSSPDIQQITQESEPTGLRLNDRGEVVDPRKKENLWSKVKDEAKHWRRQLLFGVDGARRGLWRNKVEKGQVKSKLDALKTGLANSTSIDANNLSPRPQAPKGPAK